MDASGYITIYQGGFVQKSHETIFARNLWLVRSDMSNGASETQG